jgi:hypothetical protein
MSPKDPHGLGEKTRREGEKRRREDKEKREGEKTKREQKERRREGQTESTSGVVELAVVKKKSPEVSLFARSCVEVVVCQTDLACWL